MVTAVLVVDVVSGVCVADNGAKDEFAETIGVVGGEIQGVIGVVVGVDGCGEGVGAFADARESVAAAECALRMSVSVRFEGVLDVAEDVCVAYATMVIVVFAVARLVRLAGANERWQWC